jgi:N-acetylneuraminic acid mutarotase
MRGTPNAERGRMKNKSISTILALLLLAWLSACQENKSTPVNNSLPSAWISGSSTINQLGTYGTQGTAAPSNILGARHRAVSWRDPEGSLWLFGGYGYDSAGETGHLNDLWKYDPTTHEWAWISGLDNVDRPGAYGIQGMADPSNVPGAREQGVTWIDSGGKLWLFGGIGHDSAGVQGDLNDLWKFDPTTLQWTWVSGSDTVNQAGIYGTQGVAAATNVPGARNAALSWIDASGKLWLFGGYGLDSVGNTGHLNDLWTYDPTTLQWTWVSGSNTANQSGTYGTQGTAASTNTPGARDAALSWIDSSGRFWLFGGYGRDSAGSLGYLSDLWKYDPGTLGWTWVSGSNTINKVGTYGTQGTDNSSNVPGARNAAVSWIDSSGKLWLFGGYGLSTSSTPGCLNDLWKYDPANNRWTWSSGSNATNQAGTYGTQGTAASSNVPGARDWSVSWIDSSGKLWFFGGWGYDSAGGLGELNDLWYITP